MAKDNKTTINVQGAAISILSKKDDDYISLTDMVRNFEGFSISYIGKVFFAISSS